MTRKLVAQFSVLIYKVEMQGMLYQRYEAKVVDVNAEQEVYETPFSKPALKLRHACRRAGDIMAYYVDKRMQNLLKKRG